MSTLNGKSFTNVRNINLRGGAEGPGLLRWSPVGIYGQNSALWASNPFGTADYGLYLNASGQLVFSSAGSITILGAAGQGTGGTSSWDQIYAGDQTLAIPGATLTFDGTHASNNVITITDSAAGTGHLLQITNTGTGKDINGTSGTWSFTKAGVFVAVSETLSGTAGSTVMTITAGDMVMSDGSVAITDADNAATFSVTNNSATSASMFVVAGSGTFTGNTTTSFMTLTASGLTSGTVLYIPVAAVTSGKAINVLAGTTLTSGILVNIEAAGTALTGAGRLLYVNHTGASTAGATSKIAEFATASTEDTTIVAITTTQALAGGVGLYMNTASVTTGILIRALGAALTTGSVFSCTDLAGLTTGHGIILTHATSAITTGSLLEISSSGVNTGAGGDGTLVNLTATGQLAGSLVTIDTIQTTGTAMSIISTGVMTTTGNLLTLTANAATTAAGLLRVNANGLTDGMGVVIASSADASTATGRLFLVDHSGATSTSGVLSEFKTAATDETVVVQITTAGMVDGVALKVTGTTAMTTGSLVRVSTTTAGAVSGSGIVSISGSGAHTGSVGLLDVRSTGSTVGAIVSIACSTASQTATSLLSVVQTGATITAFTGSVASFTGAGTTGSGNTVLVTSVNTTAGDGVKLVNNAITVGTGTILNISHTTSVLGAGTSLARISSTSVDTGSTTGTLLDLSQTGAAVGNVAVLFTDNSSSVLARTGVKINQTNAAAVLATPFLIANAGVTGTASKFKLAGNFCGYNIWASIDGTSPHGALGQTQNTNVTIGDICLGATGGSIAICSNAATNGTWTVLS
jgi:hypothetical protein